MRLNIYESLPQNPEFRINHENIHLCNKPILNDGSLLLGTECSAMHLGVNGIYILVWYIFSNFKTFLFLFSKNGYARIIHGIHKILVGIANTKDPDLTASDKGLCCLSISFLDRATSIQNRRTSTICVLLFKLYYI